LKKIEPFLFVWETPVVNLLSKTMLVCAAVAALLVAPAGQTQAAPPTIGGEKPVAVVSISSVDKMMADTKYVLTTAGVEQFIPMVEGMIPMFTQGVDKTKPIGVALILPNGEPQALGFIPVTDLDTFLTTFQDQIGEPTDLGGGVLQLDTPQPVFVKEQGGWAFVANTQAVLGTLPADPSALLQGLDKQYVIAVRAHVQNIPEQMRTQAAMFLNQGVQEALSEMDEGDLDPEVTRKLAENSVKSMQQLINETNEFTLGWAVDSTTKSTYIDIAVTAVPGTKMAKQFAGMADTQSDFAGFLLPDAAFTMNMASSIAAEDIEQATLLLSAIQKNAMDEIENDGDLDAAGREVAKKILTSLFSSLDATIKEGKIDMGMAVMVDTGNTVAAAGAKIAKGSDLEATVKELLELAKQEPDFDGTIALNVDSHAGVNFHRVSGPADDEELESLVGSQVELIVGFSDDQVYFGFGGAGKSLATLKKIIDQSKLDAQQTVPPFQAALALAPIMKMAAETEGDPQVRMMADLFAGVRGKDHINLVGKAISNGAQYRLEVEDGILKVLGEFGKMAAGGLGAPGAAPAPF
jgi:hypothetical protein